VPDVKRNPGHLSVALVRRFVLVLVLDSLWAECWSTGASEYCAFSELHPLSGLEVLSGRVVNVNFLGLKPQAESLNPFGIYADEWELSLAFFGLALYSHI
jgi:hypothetical protein